MVSISISTTIRSKDTKGKLEKYTITKQSLDARQKPELFYVYTIDVNVSNEQNVLKKLQKNLQTQKWLYP